MAIRRRVGRIGVAVARSIAHQHIGEALGGAVIEAPRHLVDIVHAEENVEGAVDIGIEGR